MGRVRHASANRDDRAIVGATCVAVHFFIFISGLVWRCCNVVAVSYVAGWRVSFPPSSSSLSYRPTNSKSGSIIWFKEKNKTFNFCFVCQLCWKRSLETNKRCFSIFTPSDCGKMSRFLCGCLFFYILSLCCHLGQRPFFFVGGVMFGDDLFLQVFTLRSLSPLSTKQHRFEWQGLAQQT